MGEDEGEVITVDDQAVARHIVLVGTSVGAGFLMPMQRYSDQQVPLNSKIHNSSRRANPPLAIC